MTDGTTDDRPESVEEIVSVPYNIMLVLIFWFISVLFFS